MTIRDQRQIHAGATPDEQRTFWITNLALQGITMVNDRRTLTAYCSENRWVADCPNCNGGIACWDQNPHGCCLDCGHVYTIRFPKDHHLAAAFLEQRPPGNRHWHPHRGETIRDLERENAHHLRGEG